jgi:CHRD domain
LRTARLVACLAVAAVVGCKHEEAAGVAPPKGFDVPLTPAAEVPVCPSAGAAASGMATVKVAPDDSSITVNVSYSGLSGPPTASHIHSGPAGASGPVVLPFSGSLDSPYTKTFTATDYVAAPGAPTDFGSFVTALKGGGAAYVNLHTAACKPGEIRGEIQ